MELHNALELNKLAAGASAFYFRENGSEIVVESEDFAGGLAGGFSDLSTKLGVKYLVLSTETSAALYNLSELTDGISGLFQVPKVAGPGKYLCINTTGNTFKAEIK